MILAAFILGFLLGVFVLVALADVYALIEAKRTNAALRRAIEKLQKGEGSGA